MVATVQRVFRLAAITAGAMLASVALSGNSARGVDYKIEPIDAAADLDGVSEEIAGQLAPGGIKVLRGTRSFCEMWPTKSWATKAKFAPSPSVLYPFSVGELMGVVRYERKGEDFRGQEIPAGVYTLRYGLQPVDGNHAGTSLTRDFLLLLPVEEDTSVEPIDEQKLFSLSAQVAGGTHPTMLLMMPVEGATDDLPRIVHDENNERWSVVFAGSGSSAGETSKVPVNLVVVGQAAE